MRHMNRPASVHDEIPPQGDIPNPERFRPEARLVKPIEYRVLDDGRGEVKAPSGAWEPIHPLFVEVIKGLEAGEPFAVYGERAAEVGSRITEGLHPRACKSYARRFLITMWERGHVHIPFDPPPPVFNGRYKVVQELGRGGIGVAYLCEDTQDHDRPVTVKVPWGFRQPIERTDRMMRKEAQIMQAFDHPQILRYLGSWEDGGILHVVREYIAGTGLKPVCRDRAGVDNRRERIRVLKSIARTMGYAHDTGYLLLDVCPGNFMLRHDDHEPVCIDVGHAKPHDNGFTRINYPIGSAGYASPEVIKRKGATPRSDVFGFGRTHYALLATRAPGKHVDTADLAAELRKSGAQEDEIHVMERCAAMDPDQRPADMDAVLDLLDDL